MRSFAVAYYKAHMPASKTKQTTLPVLTFRPTPKAAKRLARVMQGRPGVTRSRVINEALESLRGGR